MENAALKLLGLVETFAVCRGCITGKFVESPLQNGSFNIAFDAQQLLDNISCTTDDGMELLCCVLRQCNQMHEESVGVACRFNFITYVVLYTYHILAKEVVVGHGENIGGGVGLACLGEEADFFFSDEADNKEIDTRCCWNLMNTFLQELRFKGQDVNPVDVLTNVAASTALLSGSPGEEDAKPLYLAPQVLHEYLRRAFAYDPISWGYEAGRLAVDCFLFIYPHLFAVEGAGVQENGASSLHAVADRLVCKVSGEGDEWLASGQSGGYVVPGIAFVAEIRVKEDSDTLLGTCVCSPAYAVEALVRSECSHVDLLLLFSSFPDGVTEENASEFCRLALMVKGIEKGLVVILVKGHVGEEALRCVETWGSNTRTVLVAVAVGQATMTQLALALRVLPRALGSSRLDSSVGGLRVKPVFTSNSMRRSCVTGLRLFLLTLEPPSLTTRKNIGGIMHNIVSVVFGGSCAADYVLVERLFTSQLHHLINVICLPAPLNAVMPAGGVAEAYAVSYLRHKIDEILVKDDFPTRCFKVRLMVALKSAITTYMETVLQRSCGLSVEEAVEHLTVYLQRFDAVNWDIKGKEPHHGNGLLTLGLASGNTLYDSVIPTPPLLGVPEKLLSGNKGVKPTILLADMMEWEAQVEVVSAYLTIGMCLDRLCFTSVLGKRAVVNNSRENGRVDELFFYLDVT